MLHRLWGDGLAVGWVGEFDLGPGGPLLQFVFGNGLQVVLHQDRSIAAVAYQTWIRVGSRDDPEGREGLAHLFEHLMFRGTKTVEDGRFDREMERRGIDPDATTWLDYTYYYQLVPADALADVALLEADRLRGLELEPSMMESERQVVLRERLYRIDNDPQGSMFETLYEEALIGHPYGHATTGRRSAIEAITLAECQAFYDRYYQPGNAAVVLVGDFDVEQALRLLYEAYGGLPGHPVRRAPLEPLPFPGAQRSQVLAMPIDAELMMLGFPAPPQDHPDSSAMLLLNEALFGDPSGSLYRDLKLDKEQLTALSGWVGEFRDRALWEINLATAPTVTHSNPRRTILAALSAVGQRGLDEAVLVRARNRLELEHMRQLADFTSRAEGLGHRWATHGDPVRFFAWPLQLRAVEGEDVKRVATTYLRPIFLTEILGIPLER